MWKSHEHLSSVEIWLFSLQFLLFVLLEANRKVHITYNILVFSIMYAVYIQLAFSLVTTFCKQHRYLDNCYSLDQCQYHTFAGLVESRSERMKNLYSVIYVTHGFILNAASLILFITKIFKTKPNRSIVFVATVQ